jgi:hypothetical protein
MTLKQVARFFAKALLHLALQKSLRREHRSGRFQSSLEPCNPRLRLLTKKVNSLFCRIEIEKIPKEGFPMYRTNASNRRQST